MSRSVLYVPTPYTQQQAEDILIKYLSSEGFEIISFEGQTVWKKGYGFFQAPQFVRCTYQNNTVCLEAWIKFAILPGVYLGEMNLKGFFGAVPKGLLKSRVEALIGLMSNYQYTFDMLEKMNNGQVPLPQVNMPNNPQTQSPSFFCQNCGNPIFINTSQQNLIGQTINYTCTRCGSSGMIKF